MAKIIINWVFKTVVGRWVTASLVALLLGGSWAWWHNHKQNLREEGIQECVQEINQATVDALQAEIASREAANAALRASLVAAAAANELALDRRNQAESNLKTLQEQMETQRNEDPTYREWSDTDLPDGVAGRLREAAGSSSGSDD